MLMLCTVLHTRRNAKRSDTSGVSEVGLKRENEGVSVAKKRSCVLVQAGVKWLC
jgi:hypothetical protein